MSGESLSTWREILAGERECYRDADGPLIVAPNESVLDAPFGKGYGSAEGPPFLAWTADRVYFPTDYDGSESVGSVPRNPVAEAEGHIGS